jgi:aminoglycoside N3'-acetyltransferase
VRPLIENNVTASDTLQLSDIEAALARVIQDDDPIVVLHAGLWSFAHSIRPLGKAFVDQLIDIVIRVVGPNRTLAIPAYSTSAFPRSLVYDLARTVPETGIFAKALLERKLGRRTTSPMNSYILIGPHTDRIMSCPCATSWGPDGVMAYFVAAKALFLTLGEAWHLSCSYYHHAEEIVLSPYRYYKRFSGDLYDDGRFIGRCADVLFVKSATVPCDTLYVGPESLLRERGLIRSGGDPRMLLEGARISDIIDVTVEALTSEPYFFVRNADEVRAWVRDGKAREIASLNSEQRYP